MSYIYCINEINQKMDEIRKSIQTFNKYIEDMQNDHLTIDILTIENIIEEALEQVNDLQDILN